MMGTNQRQRRVRVHSAVRGFSLLLIFAIFLQLTPAQAELLGETARKLFESTTPISFTHRNAKAIERTKDMTELAALVSSVRLCPRKLLMYVGEDYTLVPLPLDRFGNPVHGLVFSWSSSETRIATIKSNGSVVAAAAGKCVVTASLVSKRDDVLVEVREGERPFLTSQQWDAEHASDCDDPTAQPSQLPGKTEAGVSAVTPAVIHDDDDFHNVGKAGSAANATGHPRFNANLRTQGSDNQLGSNSYNFSVPIFGSAGRGPGVNVSLAYNSRPWTKNEDSTNHQMVYDYDQGWPAPGFRLNYGRIIPDYNVATGLVGNFLLIEADGTRTPLINQNESSIYRSSDGRYIEFNYDRGHQKGFLSLPDGTLVKYTMDYGPKLVPIWIRDIHGNQINITYISTCSDALRVVSQCACGVDCFRPQRQAINYITDTQGRVVTFWYNGDGSLAEIHVAKYGSGERVVARFSYQTITLGPFNFASPLVTTGVPSGNQVDVVKRVYFPDTGRGYIFSDYSAYGMCRRISMRLGMSNSGATFTDGTEVAYTKYAFLETGALSDSPTFSERREWWLGKTDDSGNPSPPDSSGEAVFTYSRSEDGTTNTVAGPNGITSVMVSDNSPLSSQYGLLLEQRIEVAGAVKSKQVFIYDNPASTGSGLQRTRTTTSDDATPTPNQSRVDYVYSTGSYGRLMVMKEFGFSAGGVFSIKRRTVYTYLDGTFITAGLLHMVSDITVNDSTSGTDVPISRTGFIYDTPDSGWEIEKYGFTQGCASPGCPAPPGYDTSFVNTTIRGLVTKVQTWSDATLSNPDISFRHRYDIFGNEVKAEVSCCSQKTFTFSSGTAGYHYSLPVSATDAGILTTSFAYDFNTSFLNSTTDPNNLITSYAPDDAMRLRTVSYPSGATLETFYPPDANYSNREGLLYQSKFTYLDQGSTKIAIGNQWQDAAGRVVRSGSGAGANPTSYDAVKTIYDDRGRVRKTTNSYNTTDPNGDTTGLPFPTTYDYDGLSRVITVTLPDTNTVTTSYNGAVTTVTDQVGRQKQSQVDGLGRIIRVTEYTGGNTWDTTYGYDLNNNLTSVNQGGQTRSFKYDSLSRMTYERTPEQDATINEAGGTWSARYTYHPFNAISTRKDARGVITNYFYDTLNRLYQVTYDTSAAAGVVATPRVDITYGATVPEKGLVKTVSQTDAQSAVPWKETYIYDSLSRLSTRTVAFDSQAYSYNTGYGYNQASQVTQLTYPSNRVIKYGFDTRGRLNTVGDSSVATRYVSGIVYNPSQQIGSVTMGNGLTETFGYSTDGRLQLASQTVTNGGSTLMSLGYNYVADQTRNGGTHSGNSGQLMNITSGSQVNALSREETYGYDGVGRLVTASGWSNNWQRRYEYDRWGNRTAVYNATTGGSQLQSLDLQTPGGVKNNRLNSVTTNGTVYTQGYDANGNITNDGIHAYQYDGENRIVRIDQGLTNDSTFVYDSANRRVKRVEQGYTTYSIWEGSNAIAEYSNRPQTTVGGRKFYHPDRLSNRLITDSSGVVKGASDELPFGDEGGRSGEGEKHRFTSYERDRESGTDYAMNRRYSQFTGRFNRPDPIAGSRLNPQTLNRYSYSIGDPVDFSDPSGLVTCTIDGLEAPCSLAYGLLQADAAVIFRGNTIINISGNLVPIRFGSGGDLIATIHAAKNSPSAGMYLGTDENGEPIYHIGVTEKTINVVIPFGALPVSMQYQLGYVARELETDWGAQLLIGTGIGAAVRDLAGVTGASAASRLRPAVIGQLPATRALAGPLESVGESLTGAWTPEANLSWINSIATRRIPVLLASPPTPENLMIAGGRLTQFGIEYNALLDLGYYRWGGYLLPPK